ncbi:DnaA/Hda family protein, partial [Polaromonas sp.]|uniref:DnaA ATPase domain-containing protein n=1 Tax=Polaromonas sp. TaxID=1869339 RepID=UPI0018003F2C
MNEVLVHSLGHDLWQTCVDHLAQELPEQQFNTWIRPLVAIVAPDLSKVTVQVGNRFKLDWVRTQYVARIAALLEKISGQRIAIELALAPREAVTKPETLVRNFERLGTQEPVSRNVVEEVPNTAFKNRINTALTFDTLIEGTANRMGRAAALHVASSLGQLYNPLFIYGGVGLGKTHLMHAIGNKLLADNPAAKVLYIHAEQFVSDVVKAYQRKTFDEFKERYHSLDLLLIDD